jgi:hypothetical protein
MDRYHSGHGRGRDHATDPSLLDGTEVAVRVAGQPSAGIARHRGVGGPYQRLAAAHQAVIARGDVDSPDLFELIRPDLADVWLAAHGHFSPR